MDAAATDDEGGAGSDEAELRRAAEAGDELAAWALAADHPQGSEGSLSRLRRLVRRFARQRAGH